VVEFFLLPAGRPRYSAIPHANARTHKIPIGVIEQLTGKREQEALDGKRCLFEVLVVSHGDQPSAMPPVILAPSSGGDPERQDSRFRCSRGKSQGAKVFSF
jgi:hypothetical protein